MTETRTLNPQVIHDAASYLFWTMAKRIGVAKVNSLVIESEGLCLLRQPFTSAILAQYNLEDLSPANQQEFASAVASEAEYFAVNEENMNGIIYAEDAQTCKSPSAQSVDTQALRAIPKKVTVYGNLEKWGRLCLRYPLPAVVFSHTEPTGQIIEVADTNDALGFHLPMFMSDATHQQVADGLFVSRGIFHIPTPDTSHGTLWNTAIQNSTRFVREIKFLGEQTNVEIEVEW